MGNFAIAGVKDQDPIFGERFALDMPFKESGEAGSILLRPFLERVMMALRTIRAAPQKGLTDDAGDRIGVSESPPPPRYKVDRPRFS